MNKLPTLATTMTPFPYSIDCEQTIERAAQMMQEHGIHHLPVTEGGELISVISDADIKLASSPFTGVSQNEELLVKDVCTDRVYVADIHDGLAQVLRVMHQRHIGSVLVCKNGRLAGILTATDVFRKFADLLDQLNPDHGGNDAA